MNAKPVEPMGPHCGCPICIQAGAVPGVRPVAYPPPPVPPKDEEPETEDAPAGLFAGLEE